uniref:ATP synthase complex subunit 8 n=2 Tax=Gecarcoidea TaxID=45627 RepID=A0A3B8CLN7_9EUCA|nr:ATP synthase F0 subunit 8 [Gecarcoidea natalis]YP_010164072.1 ATP synthase F0 subunit 8 [Gecarcoidea lalandii]AYJ22385.1 ATP synthase F0 subunit 8 [Gecarcoidea natalis]QRK27374.1 ATP synthase F0 subunit 8 [Gecarcoidea lalandii]
MPQMAPLYWLYLFFFFLLSLLLFFLLNYFIKPYDKMTLLNYNNKINFKPWKL